MIVAKNRNGPVGDVRLAWLDRYTKFQNLGDGEAGADADYPDPDEDTGW